MVNTHLLITQETSVQTKTCGPAINILKIPITEPSVPGLMYWESIAKGKAQMLAQPIPDKPIKTATAIGFVVYAMPRKARAIDNIDIMWIFLLPNFTDKIPIGIATTKHTKLNIAKQIDEKFVPERVAAS